MRIVLFTFIFSFSVLIGFAQEKTKKQLKAEQELVKQKETEALIDSKEFEFVGDRANPQGTRSVNLTTNDNFLRFKNDTIDSAMPFFGRAYSGVGYGGSDGGLEFKGAAKDYSVKKGKKSYTIKTNVKSNIDSFDIILEIYFGGNAYLSINSSHRSPISYTGEVHKLPVK